MLQSGYCHDPSLCAQDGWLPRCFSSSPSTGRLGTTPRPLPIPLLCGPHSPCDSVQSPTHRKLDSSSPAQYRQVCRFETACDFFFNHILQVPQDQNLCFCRSESLTTSRGPALRA